MGLLKKAKTAQRTTADIIPMPWATWDYPAKDAMTAELIEAACMSARGGTESSMRRGRQNALVATFTGLTPSQCKFRETRAGWELTYAPVSVNEDLCDWTLRITRLDPENPGGPVRIGIDTPEALTVDGGLANGGRHDEIKKSLRALSTGERRPAPAGTMLTHEHTATAAGLMRIHQLNPALENLHIERTSVLTTTLPAERVVELVDAAPLLLKGQSRGPVDGDPKQMALWVFATSLLDPTQPSQARATLRDLGETRELTVTTHIGTRPDDTVTAETVGWSFQIARSAILSAVEHADPNSHHERREP